MKLQKYEKTKMSSGQWQILSMALPCNKQYGAMYVAAESLIVHINSQYKLAMLIHENREIRVENAI
jgi:hypothetical protein